MKTLIYAILGVVVAGVAAVLVGPSFVNWTAYRSDIAAQLSQATGRKVLIQGDVELDMLPRPAFSVEKLRVVGRTETDLLRADALRVDVRFAPLLRGNVRLAEVTLVAPRLVLTRNKDGAATWRVREGARTAGDAAQLPLGADLSLDTLRVTDGTVVYRDRARGRRVQLDGLNGRIATGGGRGPYEARGRVTWRGVPVTLRANLGRLGGDGAVPFGVTLEPDLRPEASPDQGGAARIRLSGALKRGQPWAARADLRVKGEDGARLLARLGAPRSLTMRMRDRAYNASARLRLAGETLTVAELDASMGEAGVTGHAEIKAGSPVAVEADLDLQRLSLDRLLATPTAGQAGAEGRERGDTGGGNGWALPEDVTAEVALSAPAVIYRGQVLRQGAAELRLTEGTLRVSDAQALLPGGGELTLAGALTTLDGVPRFDGRVEAASSNLRGLLDWLGVPTAGVAPDRLRRLRLASDLEWRPGRVSLAGMNLEVDTLSARGGVVAALGKRPGLGVGLRIDKLDLDAYTRDRPAPDAADGDRADTDATRGESVELRALLARVDANLDLRVGTLVAGGRQVDAVHLKGALERGTLTLRRLAAESVAGGALTLDGKIARVAAAKPRFDLNLNWQDVRPNAALAWLAGVEGVPRGWPAASVSGQFKGRPGDLQVNLALQALEGLLTARGDLGAGAAGELPATDLRVALQHDSLRAVLDAFTGLPQLRRDPGGVDLTAQLVSGGQTLRAEGLDGSLGGVPLSGAAAVKLGDARPALSLDLQTGALPLGAFAFGRAGGGGSDGAGGPGDWSAAPLGLRALRRFDGTLTLAADALRLDGAAAVTDAHAKARLREGVLDLAELSGALGGGKLAAKGTLDVSATPRLDLQFAVTDADAGAFGELLPGLRLGGPLTLEGDLRAQGRSERKLVETLTGSGRIAGSLRLRPAAKDGRLLDALFGAKLNGVANLARTADTLDTAFRDRDVAMQGRWRVADGVLRSDGITLNGQGTTARLAGRVNLPDWRTAAALRFRRPGQDRETAFLITELQGDLNAPELRVAGSGLDVGEPDAPEGPTAPSAPETPGSSGDREGAEPNGEADGTAAEAGTDPSKPGHGESEQPAAEDVIRDLLKELPRQTD